MLNCVAIIPARYNSARLPGKPLKMIGKKSLIEHVYTNAINSNLFFKVMVATDDERIEETVNNFGGEVFVSKTKHNSGTDRIAEVARNLTADVFFNIQADEFNLNPDTLQTLMSEMDNGDIKVCTPIFKINDNEKIFNPNQVKVTIDKNNFAIYFSRSVIPYNRSDKTVIYWGHVGVYAFKKDTLLAFSRLKQTMLEKTEKLEQLRLLENGYKIKTVKTDHNSVSIDTEDDLELAKSIYDKKNEI